MPNFTEQDMQDEVKRIGDMARRGDASGFYEEMHKETDKFKSNPQQWKELCDRMNGYTKGGVDESHEGGVQRNAQTGKEELVIPALVWKG